MANAVTVAGFPHGNENDVYGGNVSNVNDGSFWQNNADDSLKHMIRALAARYQNDTTLPTARHWDCLEFIVGPFQAADSDGDEFNLWSDGNGTSGWEIRATIINSKTAYNVRIYFNGTQVGSDGTTDIATGAGTWRQARFTWLSGQVALEVDGTVEINAGTANAIPTIGFRQGGNIGHSSSLILLIRKAVQVRGDSSSDRPDETSQVFTAIEPDSAGSQTDNAWVDGTVADWDDWNSGGGADEGTTFEQGPDDTDAYDTVTVLAVPTLAKTRFALFVHVQMGVDGAEASKDIGNVVISDGTSKSELDLGTLATDAYVSSHGMFNKAPDSGAWTQTDLGNLELGVWGKSVAASHDLRVSAVWGEFVEYDLDAGDPPPLSLIYRRDAMAPLLVR